MFCASCGAPLEPGATFCHRCGAMLPTPAPLEAGGMAPLAPPHAIVPPLDVGAALTEAMRRAFRHFGRFLATQGIFILLAGAISVGSAALLLAEPYAALVEAGAASDTDAMLAALPPILLVGGTTATVTLLLRGIGLALGIVVADGLERGETIGLGEAWARAAPRIGNLLLTSALVALAALACVLLGLPLFFLVVPVLAGIGFAIYVLVRFSLAAPASMLGSAGPRENLRRSAQLTRGHRRELFLALAGIVLVASLPSMVVGVVMAPAAMFGNDVAPTAMQTLVTGIVGTAASVVTGIVMTNFLVRLYRQRVPVSA